jgi:TRAP transporter 4TM/12TM fusion protein
MNRMEKVTKVVAITVTIWSALYISRFTDYAGLVLAPAQNQAIFLGLVMALAFLSCPAKKGMRGVKWYDWLLVVVSVVPNAYVLFFHDTWQLHAVTEPRTYELVFGIALVIALLEGLRRVMGIVLSFLTLAFMLHPIFSNYLPGLFSGRGYSVARVGGAIFLSPEGMYSMPLNIASTIVVGFLMFGGLLLVSAAGQSLTDLALSAVGRVRGGAAKAACIGSGLFGMLSGSPSANVAVTGTFTIPLMKRTGYSAMFAGGVEAAAANGGGLMPPVMGAVAFVMADMLEIPYIQVCYCAFIPAVLYYFGMFMMVDFEAGRLGLSGLSPSQIPSFKTAMKLGWPFFFPVILLIYLMFGLRFSPELSAFWTSVSVVVVSWCRKNTRIYLKKIIAALESTGKNVVQVGLACAMAGIMMASLSLTGISILLSGELVRVAAGNLLFLLILAAAASFVLGLGLPSIPCYISVSVLVAPALIQMGVPKMAAHLFVLWYAIASYITPPEGMAFFVAAAVAQANPMAVGWRAVLLGIGNFVIPFVFVYNPALLVEGYSIPQVALAVGAAALGMVAFSAGIEGYFLKKIGWIHRIVLLATGLLVFVPNWWPRLFGVIVLIAVLAWLRTSRRKEVLATRYGMQLNSE